MKRCLFVVVAVVFLTVVISGCGMSREQQEYVAEMQHIDTSFSPVSVTMKQGSDEEWPNVRARGDIGAKSYGKFTEPVVFTTENIAGSANDSLNAWVAILTRTLSVEQLNAMPDLEGDLMVYVSMAYCEIIFEQPPAQ